ncbi:hypothetical protein NLG97_g5805 [Lecanicillium saksenae]|uniref:Uncharacterized protein n=1 Tax=Lecanicillium saksenae TaxID=468837 RepID=A0ACC1QT48_9HYPO|nr:hypothetical protein NLG97_g5805 [Lecanicillium saksenae]
MKFNLAIATALIGAVSAATLKERVDGIKERAAIATPVQRDDASVRRSRCPEVFGNCEACYERYPYCQSTQIPSMITCLIYCDGCPGC